VLLVNGREPAAALERDLKDALDLRRIALQDDVFRAHIAAADVAGACAEFGPKNAQGRRGGFHAGQLRNLLRPFGFELLAREPLAGRPAQAGPGKAIADHDVRAEVFDRADDVGVQAVDHGADGDDRADSNDDAENGER